MPLEKNFKRQVRQRMAATGERYTVARSALESNGLRSQPAGGWTQDDPAVEWLLRSSEPAVRYRTLVEVLGRSEADADVSAARDAIVDGPKVKEIFAARNASGMWGDSGRGRKYTGTPYVLAVLADLRVPADDPRLDPAIDAYLDWLPDARRKAKAIDGRLRDHMGREGAALDVACVFKRHDDPRVRLAVDYILDGQWPDGGWNCDKKPSAYNSSFMETFAATRGLFRYAELTGDPRAREAAVASTGIFLRRGIIRSERTGTLISGRMLQLHWPRGYDVLAALEAIAPGGLSDPRLEEALAHLEGRRDKQGRWRANGPRPRVARTGTGEVAEFSDGLRDEMVTLRALAVLRAAGRASAEAGVRSKPRAHVRRTSKETLQMLLADAGAELAVISLEPLSRDEDGTYARVALEDGTTRLYREFATTSSMANKFMMKESFLFDALRSAGLQTPEVLAAVTGSPAAGGDPAAMLLTDGGGVPLAFDGRLGREGDLYLSVSGASARALWAEVGSMLGRLHRVDVAVAGPFAATRRRETATAYVSDWFKYLKRVADEHPIAATAVAELRSLRKPLVAFLDARPRAIRSGSASYLPGLMVERDSSRWRTASWVNWGYFACVNDPLLDVVTVERRHREWVGDDLPAAFYKAYGHDIDPLAQLIYTTARRCDALTTHWGPRHRARGYVPPFPDPIDPGQELSSVVDEVKEALAT